MVSGSEKYDMICSKKKSARSYVSRESLKQTKINFGSNRNKICFGFVSVFFMKPKTKNFGLFRCFQPISKQPKQTELFRNKPKQPWIFWKLPKYTLLQTVWVGLLFVSVQSKHRNSLFRYRSESTKTNCFETNRKKRKNRKNPKFSAKNI